MRRVRVIGFMAIRIDHRRNQTGRNSATAVGVGESGNQVTKAASLYLIHAQHTAALTITIGRRANGEGCVMHTLRVRIRLIVKW